MATETHKTQKAEMFEPHVGMVQLYGSLTRLHHSKIKISKIGVQNYSVLFFLAGTSVPFLAEAASGAMLLRAVNFALA
jgi:hypothetical protein